MTRFAKDFKRVILIKYVEKLKEIVDFRDK
jgi:hypothetical protein